MLKKAAIWNSMEPKPALRPVAVLSVATDPECDEGMPPVCTSLWKLSRRCMSPSAMNFEIWIRTADAAAAASGLSGSFS